MSRKNPSRSMTPRQVWEQKAKSLKKHPTKQGWAVCDDCQASFPPTLLKIFKIDPEKFR